METAWRAAQTILSEVRARIADAQARLDIAMLGKRPIVEYANVLEQQLDTMQRLDDLLAGVHEKPDGEITAALGQIADELAAAEKAMRVAGTGARSGVPIGLGIDEKALDALRLRGAVAAGVGQITSDAAKAAGKGWFWLDSGAASWGLQGLDGFGPNMRHSAWTALAPGVEIRKTSSKRDDGELLGLQIRPAKNPASANPAGTVYVFAYSWHGYDDARMPTLDRIHAEGFWAMAAEHYGGDPKGIESWADFELPTEQIREYPTGKKPGVLVGPPRLAVKAFTADEAKSFTEAGLLAELRSLLGR